MRGILIRYGFFNFVIISLHIVEYLLYNNVTQIPGTCFIAVRFPGRRCGQSAALPTFKVTSQKIRRHAVQKTDPRVNTDSCQAGLVVATAINSLSFINYNSR